MAIKEDIHVHHLTIPIEAGSGSGSVGHTVDVTKAVAFLSNVTHAFAIDIRDWSDATTDHESSEFRGVVTLSATEVTATRYGGPWAYRASAQVCVLEYTGVAGGPNEFVVRQDRYGEMLAGSLSTVVDISSDTVSAEKCVAFRRGEELLEGFGSTTAEQAFLAHSWCYTFSGSEYIGMQRSGSAYGVRVHVTPVEFTGSNWQIENLANIRIDTWDKDVQALAKDVGSWSNAFIYMNRKSLNGWSLNTGLVIWPGATTSEVRTYMSPVSGRTLFWDRWSAAIVANTGGGMVVEWQDSVTGSGTPIGNNTGTFISTTSGVVGGDLSRSLAICHLTTMSSLDSNQYSSHSWNTLLRSDGAGGHEVYWRKGRNTGGADWSQAVIHFPGSQQPSDIDSETKSFERIAAVAAEDSAPIIAECSHGERIRPLAADAIEGWRGEWA